MMISQLNELQKETFAQVKNVVCFRISTFLKPLIQFKENIKDCKLIDSSDDYIVKWLVGKFPFFSFRTFCWLISTPLVARWETWFKKTWHLIANPDRYDLSLTARNFDVDQAEKMLRRVSFPFLILHNTIDIFQHLCLVNLFFAVVGMETCEPNRRNRRAMGVSFFSR